MEYTAEFCKRLRYLVGRMMYEELMQKWRLVKACFDTAVALHQVSFCSGEHPTKTTSCNALLKTRRAGHKMKC